MKKGKPYSSPIRETKIFLDFLETQFKEQLSLICTPVSAQIFLKIIYGVGFLRGARLQAEAFGAIEVLKGRDPLTCEEAYDFVGNAVLHYIQENPRPPPPRKISPSEKIPFIDSWDAVKLWLDRTSPTDKDGRLYYAVLPYTKNKFTRAGRHVFPYSHRWFAKEIGFKYGTFRRCWGRLKRRGVLNKAWNENPLKFEDTRETRTKNPRSSGWLICTSLAQIGYYRDKWKLTLKKSFPGLTRGGDLVEVHPPARG